MVELCCFFVLETQINCVMVERWVSPSVIGCREAQAFVEKFEGALGKGKGRKLYAYKVMMAKVRSTLFLDYDETHYNKLKMLTFYRDIFSSTPPEIDQIQAWLWELQNCLYPLGEEDQGGGK